MYFLSVLINVSEQEVNGSIAQLFIIRFLTNEDIYQIYSRLKQLGCSIFFDPDSMIGANPVKRAEVRV